MLFSLLVYNMFVETFLKRSLANIRGRTSHRINRLALPLLSPEKFPSLSKSEFPCIMCTLVYLSEG